MDRERIQEKLGQLESYADDLKQDLPGKDEYVSDHVIRRSCERTFQLACEALLDVANLVIAQKGFSQPKDNRDSVEKLVEHDVISPKLGDRLKDMVGFRNLLVHRYGNIDDRQAHAYLREESGDFYEFMPRRAGNSDLEVGEEAAANPALRHETPHFSAGLFISAVDSFIE